MSIEAFDALRKGSRRRRRGAEMPAGAAPRKMSQRARKEAATFYLMASPWVIGFLIFLLGPMVYSFFLSFTDWDTFTSPKWVGLENYTRLLTKDDIFWKVVGNTFYYNFLAVPLGLIAGLWLANLLNKRIVARRFFRTLIYLPSLVPIVAAALVFRMILAPDKGPLNRGLGLLGIHGPAWLLEPSWVKPALVIMSLWGAGGATVLLLAAMRSIPAEFYEAAEIDGASSRRQFWSITLPQLTPILFFNLVMGFIGGFQTFSQVYILTGGGPNNASNMMVPYLFSQAFEFYHMGYASALAWLLFLIVLVFTAIAFRTSRYWVFYENEF